MMLALAMAVSCALGETADTAAAAAQPARVSGEGNGS